MRLDLYSYQEDALNNMHNGCILAGGVGTGKSRVALAYWYLKVCHGKIILNGEGFFEALMSPVDLYIITTAKKRDSLEWEDELALFSATGKHENLVHRGLKVTVDSWNNISKYQDCKYGFFIFDEQRLVGKGAWVKSFLKIAKNNEWVLLSATPGDTWLDYAAVFVANGFYANRTEYIRRHVVYEPWSKFPKVKEYVGTGVLEHYRKKILVRMDNPDKLTRRHRVTKLTNWDKNLLDTVLKDRWDPYDNKPIQNVSSMGYISRKVVNSDLSRLEALVDILRIRKRAIVFYNFNYELDALRSLRGKDGLVVAEWNGSKHEPVPDGDIWVYLVQYNAGSEGWNCVSTDTVVFYSLNYSYKVVEQCEGRIDRLNTTYTDLWYYYLRTESAVDRGIERALKRKKNFNEKAFFEEYIAA